MLTLETLREQYDIVGALGEAADGVKAYLARERTTQELVALQIQRFPDPQRAPAVRVSTTLNSSVPAETYRCPICTNAIHDWRRFCQSCGADLAGADAAGGKVDLMQEAQRACGDRFDLLGHMNRSEGGGAVFFGHERSSGRIVALNLRRLEGRTDSGPYSVSVTSTLRTGGAGPVRAEVTAAPASAVTGSGEQPLGKVCPACGREYDDRTRFCPDDGSVLRPRVQTDTLIGEVIADRFHILRIIGQGGMGQVYLAEHVRMGRRCAIKVMNRSLSQDVDAVSRFAREAANASRINSDNVAHIYDFGETKEHGVYLAMEYVEGEPLSKIIAAQAPLPVVRAVGLARQVSNALTAAHAEGVVHRDLTPNNIVVGKTREGGDQVKVVDFGIAKAMQDTTGGLTRTGFVVGTPQYMSPEQLIAEPLDGRSDVYSLGCILFEMLTGQAPFAGSGADTITRRLTEPPPHARALNQEITPALDAVLIRALARSAKDRFQSAAELRDALDAALLAENHPARRTTWFTGRKKKTSAPERPEEPKPSLFGPRSSKKEAPAKPELPGDAGALPTAPLAYQTTPKTPIPFAAVPVSGETPWWDSHEREQAVPPPEVVADTPADAALPAEPAAALPAAASTGATQAQPAPQEVVEAEPAPSAMAAADASQPADQDASIPSTSGAEQQEAVAYIAGIAASSTEARTLSGAEKRSITARVAAYGEKARAALAGVHPPNRSTAIAAAVAALALTGFTVWALRAREPETPAPEAIAEGPAIIVTPPMDTLPAAPDSLAKKAADPAMAAVVFRPRLPAGATLLVDNRPVELSGDTILLDPGQRRFTIAAPGYVLVERTRRVAAGRTTRVDGSLQRRGNSFNDAVRADVMRFISWIETRRTDLVGTRTRNDATLLEELEFIYKNSGGRAVRVEVKDFARVGSSDTASFMMKIEYADGGYAYHDFKEYRAVVSQTQGGHYVVESIHRK